MKIKRDILKKKCLIGFDGDLLNVFRIIGEDFQKRFEKNMNPRFNLFVSRMDGKANKEVVPIRDEICAFWAFNNL